MGAVIVFKTIPQRIVDWQGFSGPERQFLANAWNQLQTHRQAMKHGQVLDTRQVIAIEDSQILSNSRTRLLLAYTILRGFVFSPFITASGLVLFVPAVFIAAYWLTDWTLSQIGTWKWL
jgi:hypothetical protein